MEPRLRTAVDASIGWYEDLCALHGVGSALGDGVWHAVGEPPPLHSHAVVVEPAATLDAVMTRLDGREHCGFKDSFATVDAESAGLHLLFAATWIHREPADSGSAPVEWSTVTTPEDLAEWNAGHDTAEVLLPGLLDRAHFAVLARRDEGGDIVAGAVARLGSGAVDVSNVHAVAGHRVDWAELAAAVHGRFPGRPLVGYEHGTDLDDALAGGFRAVGELRVWVR